MIKQTPNSHECVGCVAAMATGTTLGDFRRFIWRPAPWRELDCFMYLLFRGYLMGGIGARIDANQVPDVAMIQFELNGNPAIVSVENGASLHFVYWDGENILDPNPFMQKGAGWKDYTVKNIWPVTRLDEEYHRLHVSKLFKPRHAASRKSRFGRR